VLSSNPVFRLELIGGTKSYEAVVRRPYQAPGILRAGKLARFHAVQTADPDSQNAVGSETGKCKLAAIGRQRQVIIER
jgi:hypothetical protein